MAEIERPATPDLTLVRITDLSKRYAENLVLDAVSLDLRPGEIHALLGGNGAGKSTLIKILAGVVPATSGQIVLGGETASHHYTPQDATDAGLAFVHQDLGLVESMTVAENVALTVGYKIRFGLVSHAATVRQAADLLSQIGSDVDPTALVGDLPQDGRVMVAVARAFGANARAVVLDEVSSSLPAPEMARLAGALRSAAAAGIGFLFVTHRLDELDGLADTVTVLRDGRRIATTAYEANKHEDLVEMIVGGVHEEAKRRDPLAFRSIGEGGLHVSGLDGPGLASPVDLVVAPGEIVAVCGLVGCGSRELAGLLGGAIGPISGTAQLDGVDLPLNDPAAMRSAQCAYVPGDRHADGAVGTMSIRENYFLSRYRSAKVSDSFVLRHGRERNKTLEMVDRFDVRPRQNVERPLASLSGGNQQKVIAARAIRSKPRLLVVDDPTAGVDVGARADLHRILLEAAESGTAVVLASTDYDEVALLADRALVLAAGRVVAELTGDDITAESLARHSYATSAIHSEDS